MTRSDLTDEMLMAYVDGELDPETVGRIEAGLTDDPVLAKRIEVFSRTRDILADAARARPTEPVPAPIMAKALSTIEAARGRVAAENIVPFRKKQQAPSSRFIPMAVAASLALVVGLAAGLGLSGRGATGVTFASLAPDVAVALSSEASGERMDVGGGQFVAIASFQNAEGEICREFEFDAADLSTIVSVACHDGRAWTPRFAVLTSADSGGYAPASSLETLDAYLAAIGAGEPLTPDQEAQALAAIVR